MSVSNGKAQDHKREPHMKTAQSPTEFVDMHTLQTLFDIDQRTLDDCAKHAYSLLQESAFSQAEVISRGLVAANHRFWYYRTILAVTLQKQGRLAEAIEQVNEGLRYQPGHSELVALKRVLSACA
jgi:hypothetical protein